MRRVLVLLTLTLTACDGPINPGGQGSGVPTLPSCVAEVDGVLAADEVGVAVDIPVTYVRNAPGTSVAFDPEPRDVDGVRTWDLQDGPEDVRLTLAAAAHAEAPYAVPSALEWPELLTLFDVVEHEDAVELRALGLASDGASMNEETRLRYDTPVTTLRAPIAVGDSWGGQATFRDARLAGIPNAGVEDWTFEVVDTADALLPGGLRVRDVLAIRVTTTRTLAVAAGLPDNRQTTHMIQLIAPCAGELARAVGPDAALTSVDELRRLLP